MVTAVVAMAAVAVKVAAARAGIAPHHLAENMCGGTLDLVAGPLDLYILGPPPP